MEEQTPQIQTEVPIPQTQVLSKKERRMLRREEKQRAIEHARSGQKQKNFLKLTAIAVVVAAAYGGYLFLFASPDGENIEANLFNSCVTHSGGMHIHPKLTLRANGEVQEIPSNMGISPACMRPIHTHDSSGTIHVEFPRKHDFTLLDFFKVWGKEFPLDSAMTVNDEPNSEFENLVLRDGDRIEIQYETNGSSSSPQE